MTATVPTATPQSGAASQRNDLPVFAGLMATCCPPRSIRPSSARPCRRSSAISTVSITCSWVTTAYILASTIMGRVFALSSVAGPLLGGWFTEGIGRRWAFWMNIPLGILAIASVVFFLRLPAGTTSKPRLDVAGMALLAIASTYLVLVSTWGGTTYDWDSITIIGLISATVVAAAAFVVVERRAAEPIMPLPLFTDRNFNLTTIAGRIIGMAMFGALAYLPTHLQMVTGANAPQAGFLMIPMMAALLISSIGSGQLVSTTGRYK